MDAWTIVTLQLMVTSLAVCQYMISLSDGTAYETDLKRKVGSIMARQLC